MTTEIRGIIIDKNAERAAQLNQSLMPEIIISELTIKQNPLKAVQAFKDNTYDLCLVSDAFSADDIKALTSDLKAMHGEIDCLMVQVKDVFEEGFDRKSVEPLGFYTAVSRKLTEGDKIVLCTALLEFIHSRAIRNKKVDVDTAVKLLILEIDRVSTNRRRGIIQHYDRSIVSGFLAEQISFHNDVLDGYINALERYTSDAKPDKALIVELPSHLSEINLPGIEDGQYVGTSLRVWEMLRDKFGVASPVDRVSEQATKVQNQSNAGSNSESSAEERIKNKLKDLGTPDAN